MIDENNPCPFQCYRFRCAHPDCTAPHTDIIDCKHVWRRRRNKIIGTGCKECGVTKASVEENRRLVKFDLKAKRDAKKAKAK